MRKEEEARIGLEMRVEEIRRKLPQLEREREERVKEEARVARSKRKGERLGNYFSGLLWATVIFGIIIWFKLDYSLDRTIATAFLSAAFLVIIVAGLIEARVE